MERDIDKLNTVTGIVFPAKRDKQGCVISVLIDSVDEYQDTYFVSPGKKSTELLNFINKKIEVCGKILEDDMGKLIIDVKSYNLIEDT